MADLLVTNDDGIESPALLPLVRALAELAPVRTVVPDRERSWIGKAITRWDDLHVRTEEREGVPLHAASGTPADCAQLGIHSLHPEPPGLVVSGVNVGLNHGLAFFLSSGTVGAATEGWIAGIPAVAFSVGVPRGHARWRAQVCRREARPYWEGVAAVAADVVRDLLAGGFPEGVDLLNVNFPADVALGTPRVVSELAKVGYDNLFRAKAEGVYVHDYSGGLRVPPDSPPGTDVEAVAAGRVSITPVRLAHTAPLSEAWRARLERS